MGLPEFYDASLLACHGLMTPVDLHILAKTDASLLPSAHVKTLGVRNCIFEAVPALQGARSPLRPVFRSRSIGARFSEYAHRKCPWGALNPSCSLHSFIQLRHGSKARYGWVANPYRNSLLNPSRQGLSPCKIRQAFLGATTKS
jgi:hypothetical protein